MKLTVNSDQLADRLATVSAAVPSNPIMPIIENLLLVVKGNELSLSATDMQNTVRTTLEVHSTGPFSVAVPAKKFVEIINQLPGQILALSLDGMALTIEADNGSYKLTCEPTKEFPVMEDVDGTGYVIDSYVFISALKHTSYAMAQDDPRQCLNGMYMHLNGGVTFATTDCNKIAVYRDVNASITGDINFIVPRKTVQILKQHVRPSEDIVVAANNTRASFKFEGFEVTSRLIDEKYVPFEMVLPKKNDKIVTVDRKALMSSLKRVLICSNKVAPTVVLDVTGEKFTITATDVDYGSEAIETLGCTHEGGDIRIGFNGRFLNETLGVLTSDNVVFAFSGPDTNTLILPSSDLKEKVTLALAPMLIGL
jgi:DNA polymerase III subunit beta